MREPIWIDANALRLLHGETLAEFGGLSGIRDEGLFLSALARPQNLFAYEKVTSISRLAGAYAYGIARNHPRQSLEFNSRACGAVHSAPFNDGNKRAAWLLVCSWRLMVSY